MSYHAKFKFNEILETIRSILYSSKNLLQDQIFYFMEKLAGIGNDLDDISNIKSYIDVKRRLDEVWQYRQWRDMTAEQAFLYGQLYGCFKLFHYREKEQKNNERLDFLISKYRSKQWLFQAIDKNPGIQHKDLAVKGAITSARLSQIMDEEDVQDLVSNRISGREKYYFLGPLGKKMVERLDNEKYDFRNMDEEHLISVPQLSSEILSSYFLNNNVYTGNVKHNILSIHVDYFKLKQSKIIFSDYMLEYDTEEKEIFQEEMQTEDKYGLVSSIKENFGESNIHQAEEEVFNFIGV